MWWVVVGIPNRDCLLAVKRVACERSAMVSVGVRLPDDLFDFDGQLSVFLMSGNHLGLDQQYDFHIRVVES